VVGLFRAWSWEALSSLPKYETIPNLYLFIEQTVMAEDILSSLFGAYRFPILVEGVVPANELAYARTNSVNERLGH
jgi:hypothetical protein